MAVGVTGVYGWIMAVGLTDNTFAHKISVGLVVRDGLPGFFMSFFKEMLAGIFVLN